MKTASQYSCETDRISRTNIIAVQSSVTENVLSSNAIHLDKEARGYPPARQFCHIVVKVKQFLHNLVVIIENCRVLSGK